MSVLTDRASLARAFYRLTATSATNPALIEHDSSSLETLYQYLQYGAWDAQEYMIDAGLGATWVTTSSTLTFSGADSTGGKYVALPSDFLRLAGDDEASALRQPGGTRWGLLIPFEERRRAYGNKYWLQGDGANLWRIWLARGASPPSDLVCDYHHRLATLADSTAVDFPTQHRALIVAFAADRAQTDSWLPGDMEMQAKIASNLVKLKKEVMRRARVTDGPKRMKIYRSGSTHWWGA